MFEELNNFAGWNLKRLPREHFLLLSSSRIDGSFLLHHCLSMFLKSDSNVLFLMVAQTFPHYNMTCSKLGANLERCKTEGKLKILNLLDASLNAYLGENKHESKLVDVFESLSTQLLYQEIRKHFDFEKPNAIIFDDLSMLLNMGVSEQDLIKFVRQMSALCQTRDSTFIIYFCKDIIRETSGHYLYQNCRLYADTELLVTGLESGYSKDVHGNVSLFSKNKNSIIRWRSKSMQYKLTDKNLRLFASGTSAAVL